MDLAVDTFFAQVGTDFIGIFSIPIIIIIFVAILRPFDV